jgi:hypothetical protein
MSIDPLLDRVYHRQKYNCVHFSCDAWRHITGFDLAGRAAGVLRAVSEGQLLPSDMRAFKRLAKPVSPCIVLFNGRHVQAHIGVYYNGKVLHITESGVQYMPLDIALIGFESVRFYH